MRDKNEGSAGLATLTALGAVGAVAAGKKAAKRKKSSTPKEKKAKAQKAAKRITEAKAKGKNARVKAQQARADRASARYKKTKQTFSKTTKSGNPVSHVKGRSLSASQVKALKEARAEEMRPRRTKAAKSSKATVTRAASRAAASRAASGAGWKGTAKAVGKGIARVGSKAALPATVAMTAYEVAKMAPHYKGIHPSFDRNQLTSSNPYWSPKPTGPVRKSDSKTKVNVAGMRGNYDAPNETKSNGTMRTNAQARAERRRSRQREMQYKGKYYGPDAFKGNISKIEKWKKETGGDKSKISKYAK